MPSKTASTAAFASDCDNPTSDATTLANWSLFIAVLPFFNISYNNYSFFRGNFLKIQ
jgi:hypothetical protein